MIGLLFITGASIGIGTQESPRTYDLIERVEVGVVRTLHMSLVSESELLDSRTLIDGEVVPAPAATTRTTVRTCEVTFSDTRTAIDPGGFQRAFERTARTSSMRMVDPFGGRHSSDGEQRSPLEGLRVAFDGDGRRVVEEPSPDVDLSLLDEGPHWAAWLPGSAVGVGESWELELANIAGLRDPGGDLQWTSISVEGIDQELIIPAGATQYTGTVRATLEGVEGGLASISLALEGSTTLDLTPFLEQEADSSQEPGSERLTIESDSIETVLQGGGLLRWDLDAGRPSDLELTIEQLESERIDYGHSELSIGPTRGPHDVKIESITESRISDRLELRYEVAPRTRPDGALQKFRPGRRAEQGDS